MDRGKDAVEIGTSVSMPTAGEAVEVDILPSIRKAEFSLEVIAPTGESVVLALDKDGKVIWQPKRYGKHLLRYGDYNRQMWVVSRPVIFNWWSTKTCPNFITAAMLAKDDSAEYWRRRGVIRLHWIGGEYLSRAEHENPFHHSKQWFDQWWGRLAENAHDPLQGVCLDELFATDERMDGVEIPKAVTMLHQAAGADFAIGIYCSGLTETFSTGMWYLRQSDAYHLIESYWGTEDIYLGRWQAVALYRLQERAVLVISPGFNQSERVRGSLTPEALRDEFAMVRRVAPDAAGLGVFNAYNHPHLERLVDELIEEYFLKPVIHLQPHNGKLLTRNIGHEDAIGFSITFLNDTGEDLQSIHLEKLEPMQSRELPIPQGAKAARVHVPQDAVNIYPGGIYQFPAVMNPLQVTSTSVADMAVLVCEDGNFTFSAAFNKPLNPDGVKSDNVTLHGALSGLHDGQVSYDNEKQTLSVTFQDLPADFYTLRLLGGQDKLSDAEGLPFDGTGNGILELRRDHHAIHFRLDRGNMKLVLPLP